MKRKQLNRCTRPGLYFNEHFKELKCVGQADYGNIESLKGVYYELYEIPGTRDFGVIESTGLMQVGPYEWYKDKVLRPPPKHPLNTRLSFEKTTRGTTLVRVLPVPARTVVKRTTKKLEKRKIIRRSS